MWLVQSVLAALGGVQFVSNVFFAFFILKETPTRQTISATTLIVIGLIIAILYSNHVDKIYSNMELISLYDTTYMQFLFGVVVLVVSCELLYLSYTRNEALQTPLPASGFVRPLTYCIVSATIGTQSILQTKCLSELAKSRIVGVEGDILVTSVVAMVGVFAIGLSFWVRIYVHNISSLTHTCVCMLMRGYYPCEYTVIDSIIVMRY
jgi:magnesium transporter